MIDWIHTCEGGLLNGKSCFSSLTNFLPDQSVTWPAAGPYNQLVTLRTSQRSYGCCSCGQFARLTTVAVSLTLLFWQKTLQTCVISRPGLPVWSQKWLSSFRLRVRSSPAQRCVPPQPGCRGRWWPSSRSAADCLHFPFQTLSPQSQCSWWNRNILAVTGKKTRGCYSFCSDFFLPVRHMLSHSWSLQCCWTFRRFVHCVPGCGTVAH